MYDRLDTIVALSTPPGSGAIGVVRLSGQQSIVIADDIFIGKVLKDQASHTLHFGKIQHDNTIIDEVVISIFKAPHSYTKENVIEISCHGSPYIIQKILELCIQKGARMAAPGEFTLRSFLNGRMDLSQAEAVADLIASESKESHKLAIDQMRGGISQEIQVLRTRLIKFASLIELENDFSEEDVEFANRTELIQTLDLSLTKIQNLLDSFRYGNAIKEGIAVAIVGSPNVGKSTLLNALLNEEKAIVSPIAGTTRDLIEDTLIIDGYKFRFIDTAGIRETTDFVESLGIDRTIQQIRKAQIVIFITEISEDFEAIVQDFKKISLTPDQHPIIVLNKSDAFHACHQYDVEEAVSTLLGRIPVIALSAKEKTNLPQLKRYLVERVESYKLPANQAILSNSRHYESFSKTYQSLAAVRDGLKNQTPSDLIALDIRHALHHLGEVSGTISTDDLLDSIFRDFCIGK